MIIAVSVSISARWLIESVGHVEVLWSRWFLAYVPCTVITILIAWRLTLWMFPPESATLPGGAAFLKEGVRHLGPLTALEKRAALLMVVAVALWLLEMSQHSRHA